jgi:hypothetical protein
MHVEVGIARGQQRRQIISVRGVERPPGMELGGGEGLTIAVEGRVEGPYEGGAAIDEAGS